MLLLLLVAVLSVAAFAILAVVVIVTTSGDSGDYGNSAAAKARRANLLLGGLLADLPIGDLKKQGGGAWKLQRGITWKKSSIVTFQGQPAIRVFYEKNSGVSGDPGVGGMSLDSVPNGLPGNGAIVAFDVFFEEGWDWSEGGKMVGFGIGHGPSSGGDHSGTSASHRLMFREGGGATSYIYPPSNLPQDDPKLKADGFGISYFYDTFPPGTLKIGAWNSVQLGVRINSFDAQGNPNPDGEAMLAINGKTDTKSNIRWARSKDLRISGWGISTFFGGPDPAKVDCVSYYRNFALFAWK